MTNTAFNPFEQLDAATTKYHLSELKEDEFVASPLSKQANEDTPTPNEDTLAATPNEDSIPGSVSHEDATDWKKRYSDLKSHVDKNILPKLKETEKSLKEATKKPVVIPKTDSELAAFKEANKEAYDFMVSVIRLELIENSKEFKDQYEELKQNQVELAKEKNKAEFNKYHPDIDIDALKTDPKFIKWFTEQTPDLQNLIQTSGSPATFAKIIDIYKKDVGIVTKTKKELELEATKTTKVTSKSTPSSDGKKRFSMAEIKAMNQDTYEKLEAEIDLAFREGRVDA